MTIDKQLVWVRDPNEGFVMARIFELMGEEVDVIPVDNKYPRRVCSFDDVFPAGDPTKGVDDNCKYWLLIMISFYGLVDFGRGLGFGDRVRLESFILHIAERLQLLHIYVT